MEDFFNIGAGTIPGDREYQDDYYERHPLDSHSYLLILADGMGGYAGGSIASRTVVKNFKANFDKNNSNIKEALHQALIKANEALAHKKETESPKLSQMGTTLIAVYITQSFMQWVSVGDSPLWIVRKKGRLYQYEIERINKNHSIAGLLELQFKHGEIDKEERDSSPNRHMLTSAITGEELKSIDLSNKFPLEEGDIVILATDGIETLKEDEIKEIIRKSKDNIQATKDILDAVIAKKSDNQDNSTIIIASPKEILKDSSNDTPNYINNQIDKNPKPFYSQILSPNKLIYISSFIVVVLFLILLKILWIDTKVDNNTTTTRKENNATKIKKEDNKTVVKTLPKLTNQTIEPTTHTLEETNMSILTPTPKKRTKISPKALEAKEKEDNSTVSTETNTSKSSVVTPKNLEFTLKEDNSILDYIAKNKAEEQKEEEVNVLIIQSELRIGAF